MILHEALNEVKVALYSKSWLFCPMHQTLYIQLFNLFLQEIISLLQNYLYMYV